MLPDNMHRWRYGIVSKISLPGLYNFYTINGLG
jgi:hypothetical protein